MIPILLRIKAWFAPFEVCGLEAMLVRLGIALATWTLFPLQTYPGEPHPNGLAKLLPGDSNFTWLHNPQVMAVCQWLMAIALVLYVFHRFAWLAYPVIVGLLIASGTLTNSQSAEVTHHSQLMTLVLLTQAVWYFVGWRHKRITKADFEAPARWHQLAFFFSMQIIMAGYMVSVVSKMVYSDGKWIAQASNIPVQLEKNRLSDYYNTAGMPAASAEPSGAFARMDLPGKTQALFIANPNVARAAMTTGMLLEALCFLALLGRRPALLYGLLLILFHLVIAWTMNLTFTYHIILLALYFVGLPYWLTRWLPESVKNHQLVRGG